VTLKPDARPPKRYSPATDHVRFGVLSISLPTAVGTTVVPLITVDAPDICLASRMSPLA